MTDLTALTAATEIAASLSALLGTEFEACPDGSVTRAAAPVRYDSDAALTAIRAKRMNEPILIVAEGDPLEAPILTVKEMRAIAKQAGLKGCSRLRKAELIERLMEASLL